MRSFDVIIGIDPGAGGGISYYKSGVAKAVRMPKSPKDMQDFFRYLQSLGSCIGFMERLQLRPQDRNIPGREFGIQKMLGQYERLRTTLSLNNVLICDVHPKTWQSYLNLKINKTETKSERKLRYRDAAQVYYPSVKANLWNCDALLLLEFGRRKFQYDPDWIYDNITSTKNSIATDYRDAAESLF